MSRLRIDEIMELPPADRVELAQQILESVYQHPETVTLTAAQRDELERRWLEFEQRPDDGESWEVVKQSLLDE